MDKVTTFIAALMMAAISSAVSAQAAPRFTNVTPATTNYISKTASLHPLDCVGVVRVGDFELFGEIFIDASVIIRNIQNGNEMSYVFHDLSSVEGVVQEILGDPVYNACFYIPTGDKTPLCSGGIKFINDSTNEPHLRITPFAHRC